MKGDQTLVITLSPAAAAVLQSVHSRGFHGGTLEQTAAQILTRELTGYLPDSFRWVEQDADRAGFRVNAEAEGRPTGSLPQSEAVPASAAALHI